jgi:hypothetical protein
MKFKKLVLFLIFFLFSNEVEGSAFEIYFYSAVEIKSAMLHVVANCTY